MKKKLFIIGGILVSLLYVGNVKAWCGNIGSKYYGLYKMDLADQNTYPPYLYGNANILALGGQQCYNCYGDVADTDNYRCGISNSSTQYSFKASTLEDTALSNCSDSSVAQGWGSGFKCKLSARATDNTVAEPKHYAYKIPTFKYANDKIDNSSRYYEYIGQANGGAKMIAYHIIPIQIGSGSNGKWYNYRPGTIFGTLNLNGEIASDVAYFQSYNAKVTKTAGNKPTSAVIDRVFSDGNNDTSAFSTIRLKYEGVGRFKNLLFDLSISVTPEDFFKQYALKIKKSDFKLDYSSGTLNINNVKFETVSGNIYGQPIKALEDNVNLKQRDYVYYLVYSIEYTYTPSNVPEPDPTPSDCVEENNNNVETDSSSNTCESHIMKNFTKKCGDINNYEDVHWLANQRKDFCYLTSFDGSSTKESATLNINLGSNERKFNTNEFIKPVAVLTLKRNYKLVNNTGGGQAAVLCTIRTIQKLKDFPQEVSIGTEWKCVKSETKADNSLKLGEEAITLAGEAKYNCTYNSYSCFNSNSTTTIVGGNEVGKCGSGQCYLQNKDGYLYVTDNGNVEAKYSDFDLTATCDYEVQKSVLNYIYRPISLENPFPGMTGSGRKIGANWSDPEEGDPVEDVIKKEMDKQNPMYVINLTPDAIREIRTRYSNNYSEDAGRVDDATKACEALNDGKYISGMIENLSETPSASADGSPSIIEGRCITNNQTENRKCVENFSG